jgi:tetratricopeptide (TPR) repeat protein
MRSVIGMRTQGQFDLASKEYRAVVTLDPRDDVAWFDLGELELIQGRKSNAIEAHEPLKTLNPGLASRLQRLFDLSAAKGVKSSQ